MFQRFNKNKNKIFHVPQLVFNRKHNDIILTTPEISSDLSRIS